MELKYKVDERAIRHYNVSRIEKGLTPCFKSLLVARFNAVAEVGNRIKTGRENVFKVIVGDLKLTVDESNKVIKFVSVYGDKNECFTKESRTTYFPTLVEKYEQYGINTYTLRMCK